MLQLYVKENKFANRKKRFSFFSKTGGIITLKRFIKEIAAFNASATEADAEMILNIVSVLFCRFITEGFAIQLPMGTFKACASGTADRESDSFSPKSAGSDHTITLHFQPNEETKNIVKETKYTRISGMRIHTPSIISVLNEAGQSALSFHHGEMITVTGRYLTADMTNPEQGLFLQQKDIRGGRLPYRFKRYSYATKGRIGTIIPDDLPSGEYTLYVVSQPDMTQLTDIYSYAVTILPGALPPEG